ncbi:MAG: hypothetical protein DRI81_20420 [Chloroflexi bacterium]|nr:MAG: hypothetical protein DRI81_20420 [Chloroflexota bacterium]
MTKRRRDQFERQTVVDAQTIEALTGSPGRPSKGIVETLVEQQLGTEREQERKRPKRPTEVRRGQRRVNLTFSVGNEGVPDQLRDIARRWGLYTVNGLPSVSQVVEYLLLPQLRKAVAGEIAPPSNGDGKNEKVENGEQWF